jgi:uncharacterized protein (TIGR02145 family)
VNGSYSVPSAAPTLVLDTVYGNGNVGTAVVRLTNPGAGVFERGIVWSSSPNPTVSSSKSVAGSGGFGFTHTFPLTNTTTVQYARAYARTNAGVYYSTEKSFSSVPWNRCLGTPSITDIDGNVYNTVQIGTQCWTQSNLKVSKYRNGDNIPTGLSNSDWSNTTSGAYAIYDNDPVNDGLYGKLYNNYAVTDSRGLCPTGWHVPSDGEWTTLENHLGGASGAGGALKSTAMQPTPGGWYPPNAGATNSSGFTALPGGIRAYNGFFGSIINLGVWWSSSLSTMSYAWLSTLYSNYGGNSDFYRDTNNRTLGVSVRCLKNTLPHVNTTSVTSVTPSTALVTGEAISDGGDQNTIRGFCYSNTSNPTISNDTTMNGTGIGVYSGTLQNLTQLTTYFIRAYATNSVGTSYGSELNFTTDSIPGLRCPGTPTVTDIDGNVYNTVQIGTQCWTQSNLKVSKYRNGDNIPTGLSNSAWESATAGAYAIYNNDLVNDGLYGKMYNHYAVTDSRGLCPTGWHVPTDGELSLLMIFLDPSANISCGGCSQSSMGGTLKSTVTQPTPGGWNSPNTGATNSSGLNMMAGGFRDNVGNYIEINTTGNIWSATIVTGNNSWTRNLFSYTSVINRWSHPRSFGTSVRCLKD